MKKTVYYLGLLIIAGTAYCTAAIQVPPVIMQRKQKKNQQLTTNLPITNVKVAPKSLTNNSAIISTDITGTGKQPQINLRGFGDNAAQNSLIMIDGVPITNPDLAIPNLSFLPFIAIDHVEILENSSSVLYGDQAVGGVINIVTKKFKPKKQFLLSYGSFKSMNLGISLADKLSKNWNYHINVNHFNSQHYRDHNNENTNNANAGLSYKDKTTKANLDYFISQQSLQLPGAITEQQLQQNRRQANNDTDVTHQIQQLLLGDVTQQLSPLWQLHLNGSAAYDTGDGVVSMMSTPYDFNNKRYNIYLKPELIGVINIGQSSIYPIIGITAQQAQYQYNSDILGSKDQQGQFATFGHIKVPLFSQLDLTTGARWAINNNKLNNSSANFNNTDHVTVADVGLTEHFTKHWSAYARVAQNYRFPKVDEEILTQNQEPLKPQTGVSYESGLQYKQKKTNLRLAVFQLDLNNEIAYVPVFDTTGLGYNENIDKTRRQGISADFDHKLYQDLTVKLGYRYVNAYLRSGQYQGNVVPAVPHNSVFGSGEWQFLSHWTTMLMLRYVGTEYPSNDFANQAKQPQYYLLNAGLQYKYKKMKINLRVNNLTNKRYNTATVLTYDQAGTPQIFYYPADGISATLGVIVTI